MKRLGLVFKIDDECWIIEYFDGTLEEEAHLIEDNDGIYSELNPREFALVEIITESEEAGKVSLIDLKTITIKDEENPYCDIKDIIERGDLSSIAELIFEEENN